MAELTVLDVRLHGRKIGTLTRLPGDRILFVFEETYVTDPARPTLSLSFKDQFGGLLTDSRPTQTRLPPFFSNLLPEGSLRDYLAARARVKPEREFFLAWVLGRDLPGALQILPDDHDALPLPLDAGGASDALPDADDEGILRFSLAGVQLKFSAVQQSSGGLTIPAEGVGGSWIVKLPSTRFVGVPENEFAMMEIAREIGIDVPATRLVPVSRIEGLPKEIDVAGDVAFAIRRFDRDAENRPVHMEDLAQVFGVYPERKYKNASYRNIAEVLWVETGAVGIAEFIRRLVFSVLIGNADMHLKNWSLVYPDRHTAQLSPAYDLVSTIAHLPDDKLALTLVDSKAFASVSTAQFRQFAAKAGLPEKLTIDTVRDTVARFAEVWRGTDRPPEKVRNAIDAHLKTMPLWTELAGASPG